jgi:predicted acyltransferase
MDPRVAVEPNPEIESDEVSDLHSPTHPSDLPPGIDEPDPYEVASAPRTARSSQPTPTPTLTTASAQDSGTAREDESRIDPTELPESAVPQVKTKPARVGSIDAFRGLVMLLMAAEVLRLHRVAEIFPNNDWWVFLAHHQSHVPWQGWTLHDLIQPAFTFLVGVALPWSIASRQFQGQSVARMFLHTLWRSFLLIGLGIWLRSVAAPTTNFTFEDTLTQIGLGYSFVWILAWMRPHVQLLSLLGILLGYWLLFVSWPAPSPDFDPATVGVPADWPHWMSGFAAHWNKNIHPAHAFDVWFLNLFPRETPFEFNRGGYVTLSFIPTLGTMILGLFTGQWLRNPAIKSGATKVFGLLAAGLVGIGLGLILDRTGVCPSVKRLWTPSWVLFSGGCCAVFLAVAYAIIDVARIRFWSVPLMIFGANSIFAYVIIHLWEDFIRRDLRTHLGSDFWANWTGPLAPVWEGGVILAIFWLCCFWLWRRQIFIRI